MEGALNSFVNLLDSLSWIGTYSYVIKSDAIDAVLGPVSSQLGMDVTIIKYTAALFLVYPFSFLLSILPNKTIKHFLSASIGFVLMQLIYGPDWIHSFITALGTYLLCLFTPRKYCPYIVFVFVMGYMTASHLYRMYVSYLSGIFDFTGTQMVLTMKLTSFAYNLYDGTYDKKNVFKAHDNKSAAKLYAERKKFAIEELPSLLEYFGYVYCFTCLLAGPAFEYNDYIGVINGSVFAKSDKQEKGSVVVKQPSSLLPSFLKFSAGAIYLAAHVVFTGMIPLPKVFDPSFVQEYNFWHRCGYLYLALFAVRFKYYFVWMVAEGASNMGGFGFQGYNSEGKVIGWEGVKNMDIIGFETASNIQSLSRAWNKRTQGWLERYTYARTNRSLLITYFVSALWHGLYPGFFIFFMSLPLLTNVERLLRAKITPLIAPEYDGFNYSTYPKTAIASAYWILSIVITTIFVTYAVQTFNYGSLERCMIALGGFYYLGHVISVAAYLVLSLLPTPKVASKGKKTE